MFIRLFRPLGVLYIIPFFMSIYVAGCSTFGFIQPQQNINVAIIANDFVPQNNSPGEAIASNDEAILGNLLVAERNTITIPNSYVSHFKTMFGGKKVVAKNTIIGITQAYGDGVAIV